MRVILNQDVLNLGELGDLREVAPGYARNFLFPRGLAVVATPRAIELFKRREAEIEQRREEKRKSSMGLKERLEAEEVVISVPAGHNGKLYGAVTNATVYDELLKKGIEIERKKIEVPGHSIKNIGSYKVTVHLYEKEEATLLVKVEGHAVKAEVGSSSEEAPKKRERRERRRSEEDDSPEAQLRAFLAAQGLEPEADEPQQQE
ncbi:MAG TPA: 50S ribosomal protein L9 [Rectinemataceae bacterium]|nr:50S ribosomal protein L9 [Rectinemataceae bacterium]